MYFGRVCTVSMCKSLCLCCCWLVLFVSYNRTMYMHIASQTPVDFSLWFERKEETLTAPQRCVRALHTFHTSSLQKYLLVLCVCESAHARGNVNVLAVCAAAFSVPRFVCSCLLWAAPRVWAIKGRQTLFQTSGKTDKTCPKSESSFPIQRKSLFRCDTF